MKQSIVLIGKESVGKSTLVRTLTGKNALSEKLKGTTLAVQSYETNDFRFIDTPGILLESDSVTTKLALEQIHKKDCVALIVSATSLDEDLTKFLPLVKGKKGVLIVNFWNLMKKRIKTTVLKKIEKELGVSVIPVDARKFSEAQKKDLLESISNPKVFKKKSVTTKVKVTLKPQKDIFDIPILGKIFSLILLFVPAWLAVQFAISLADSLYGPLFDALGGILQALNTLPAPLNHLLAMDYGIVAMFPFLILYALPTVFLFAIMLSLYKSSGLIDRLTVSLHPLVKHFGLTGRDLVRVIMGFGCNVPAVISTRSCSSCTRKSCISAISFGAACSYQLPATIAVFAAAKMEFLIIPYLIILAVSTLIYTYIVSAKRRKLFKNKLLINDKDFLQLPSWNAVIAETKGLVTEFLTVAFPIFLVICLIAGALDWLGAINALSWLLAPVMAMFNLPAEAATAVVLGSIRKDGIAIGLLNSAWDGLKIPITSPVQVLTVVYLAGVLLPCIVTLFTIAKEVNIKFALKLLLRQVFAAVIFSLLIAWIGYFLF